MAPILNEKDELGINNWVSQSTITMEGSTILANGHPILTQVPSNIVVTPLPNITKFNTTHIGCFLGFNSDEPRCTHIAPIGKLKGIRFMSIFRFKVWWSTLWVGKNGNDVENETQIMVLDKNDVGQPYVLFLPILEGPFRASIQSGDGDDFIDLCVESGSTKVIESKFRSCLYIHIGDDPYFLVKEAMKIVRNHLGTFKLLEEKNPPSIIDKFGWCTWDAFYTEVNPKGIWEGIKGLVENGLPPKWVMIDDGWQSICHDDDDPMKNDEEGMNIKNPMELGRLAKFEENFKFRNYKSSKFGKGMGGFVKDLKEEFKSIDRVYVWHALCSYWGGIRPNVEGMVESRLIFPDMSERLLNMMDDCAMNKLKRSGIGFVPPEFARKMYEGLHSHLEMVGIDGVKIDAIHFLEMVCEEYGGRVELAKAYYNALTDSVNEHLKGNGVIASMQQCNDFMFLGTQAISLGRVGDDFWCIDPYGDPNGIYWLQGCHMVHCAYNSLWMGNFIHPDWDMFQSTHPCAEFHAASRAISGGPIYVSDSIHNHNVKLLKSLVLPDGTILRCQYFALPTKDCLFNDPLHDGKTVLKIWNLNKYTGVLGLFNCQGGGWCPISRRNKSAGEFSVPLNCSAGPEDVEWSNGNHPISTKGVKLYAVYMFLQQRLKLLKSSEKVEMKLHPLSYEVVTVSPVITLQQKGVQFAPIGVVNMMNSGGGIEGMEVDDERSLVRIRVKGYGEVGVFASMKPLVCSIDGRNVGFTYRDLMVRLSVPWLGSSSKFSVIHYLF